MTLPLPDYWLPRPDFDLTPALRAEFDRLLDEAAASSTGGSTPIIHYRLSAPRWQFLCYASEVLGLALHGSPSANITRFEPRKANDLREFGDQEAVYAASDGIWPMYFAIIDRTRVDTTLVNACVRLQSADGVISAPLYVFSVSRPAFASGAFSNGWVYLLPRESFISETPMPFGGYQVHIAQLASLEPVTPLARLEVSPHDFPFLSVMRQHDDSRLAEYAQAMSTGQPWPDPS